MRQRAFIEQNKEKWSEIEKKIESSDSVDALVRNYLELKNDLSFAQTFYPKSSITVYLTNLVIKHHFEIYKLKKTNTRSVLDLWRIEVPLLIIKYRKVLQFTFVLFFVFVLIGALSAHYDDRFVRLVLGDDYVNMTLDNIEKGNPLAVYSSGSKWGSAFGITFNNIRVGMMVFIGGILGGVGTLFVLFQNCIMLGSFQYFFYQQGVFLQSIKGVWIHGSMEIFAIIIETFAGFILGSSILFPKTYSRLKSMQKGFKDSFKIFLSTIPFTIAAGILEGYVTRYYNAMNSVITASIILGTLGFIGWYYLFYPKQVKNKLEKYI
jgi:uncharacterized membrane protein SpoIIM required for sporulation